MHGRIHACVRARWVLDGLAAGRAWPGLDLQVLKVLVQHVFDHFGDLARMSSTLSPASASARRMRIRRAPPPNDRTQVGPAVLCCAVLCCAVLWS